MTDTNPNIPAGSAGPSGKQILVDLSAQMLYAREGERTVYAFPVSTGKSGKTPIGHFTIWIKLRYTRMKGGRWWRGTHYDFKNVPFTMYFCNAQVPKSAGFGIHGAYWHDNFGHPMSHGCINLRPEDAERLYNWADPPTAGEETHASDEHPGTPITIQGITPNE